MPASDTKAATPSTPEVLWAQRKDSVFLSIVLSDIKKPDLKISADKVHFSGNAGPDQKPYALDIELNGEVDPDKSTYVVRDRLIDIKLEKKDTSGKFWPRLMKSSGKYGWLKTDFARWKDEDDEDDDAGAGFGGGMGGMGDFGGGMGGMGGMGGFGDNSGDLERMMQQMGGPGGPGGDESDDDVPGLERKEGDPEEESDDDMPKLE